MDRGRPRMRRLLITHAQPRARPLTSCTAVTPLLREGTFLAAGRARSKFSRTKCDHTYRFTENSCKLPEVFPPAPSRSENHSGPYGMDGMHATSDERPHTRAQAPWPRRNRSSGPRGGTHRVPVGDRPAPPAAQSSIQSKVRVTAFFHMAYSLATFSESIWGVHSLSLPQFARRSSTFSQNPTASPAA